MVFFIVAWVKRRSTRTTMVLSCLSLTTTPWSVRFGISNPLLRLLRGSLLRASLEALRGLRLLGFRLVGFRLLGLRLGTLGLHFRFRHRRDVRHRSGALLRGDGFQARDVAADDAHARGVLQLPGGALETQVELLLLELEHFVLDLVERHRSCVCGFHGST